MALRSSISAEDPYHVDLHCSLQQFTLVQKLEMLNRSDSRRATDISRVLKGFDAITFQYEVAWPLSLVLSKKAITKYQLIFRHLFSIKHVLVSLLNIF